MVIEGGDEADEVVVIVIFVIDDVFEGGVSVVEVWVGFEEADMLTREHANFGVGAGLKRQDLVGLRLVLCAGGGFDEAGGLADVLDAEE